MNYKKSFIISGSIGVLGSLLFSFAFPEGALSTLMHQVLHLPGPGAGIVLVVGPFVLACALLATLFSGQIGVASLTALFFGLTNYVATQVWDISTGAQGKFGSFEFILGLLLCGFVLDLLLHVLQKMKFLLKVFLSACTANIALILFFWLVIFSQTKGWVKLNDALILILASLVGSGISTGLIWGISILRGKNR